MIAIIVAVADQLAIGKDQDLLCYLPADLKHFRELTTGHAIIMGRKTFESLPKGALPNRMNIVMSRNPEIEFDGVVMVRDMKEALDAAKEHEQIFIIGGASVYREALDFADTIYLTRIHHDFTDADTFFPQWTEEEWQETFREDHVADEKNKFPFSFITLTRK